MPISVKSPSDGEVELLRIIMVDMMKYCTSVVASGRCDISKDLPDNAYNNIADLLKGGNIAIYI